MAAGCETCVLASSAFNCVNQPPDMSRWGVWLGRHICERVTQVSQGELNEARNLMGSKRAKAHLIVLLSSKTNCESMAYRSFTCGCYHSRGVRKVTIGITGLWQPSVPSDVAF